jgi:hypothetical protein
MTKINLVSITFYIFIILIVCFIGKKYTSYSENKDNNEEYKLIQKYLLNDSPLYGYNKPKLWIHSKYEYNTRKWKSFQSRSSTELNQPYIHLTIKSIILHCSNDFNICLIDDDSFSKLIPSWTINMKLVPEPKKTHYRQLGISKLLYFYGGIVVPNSFLCRKNLKPLYLEGIQYNTPFVCENINRSCTSTAGTTSHFSAINGTPEYIVGHTALLTHANNDLQIQKSNPTLNSYTQRLLFLPFPSFMGSQKNDPVMLNMVEFLNIKVMNSHFSSEAIFLGEYSHYCLNLASQKQIQIIDGDMIGVKTMKDRKPILLENLIVISIKD